MLNSSNVLAYVEQEIKVIRERVKNDHVVCAVSGGLDSTLAAMIVNQAIGNQLHCVFVDNGFLRHNEAYEVLNFLRNTLGLNVWHVDAKELFLSRLQGVINPELKRSIISSTFIDVFTQAAKDLNINFPYLVQGTIAADILELKDVNDKKINRHHNVIQLPLEANITLIEPLRHLEKNDVKEIAKFFNLPKELINRQPFPGPGLAIRIIGEVTEAKLTVLRKADYIFSSLMEETGLASGAFQYFCVLTNTYTTGIKENYQLYGQTIALRAISSKEGTIGDIISLPYKFLKNVSEQICLQIPEVNRVVYDLTTKPPGTIEWE